MVSWRAFWITSGCPLTGAAGGVPVLLDLHPAVTTASAAVVTVAALGMVGFAVERAAVFIGTTDIQREWITSLIRLAVTAHTGWVVTLVWLPGLWGWLVAALIGLAATEWGVAWLYDWATRTPQRTRTRSVLDLDYTPQDDTSQVFRAGLTRAGLGHLVLDEWRPVGGDAGDGSD